MTETDLSHARLLPVLIPLQLRLQLCPQLLLLLQVQLAQVLVLSAGLAGLPAQLQQVGVHLLAAPLQPHRPLLLHLPEQLLLVLLVPVAAQRSDLVHAPRRVAVLQQRLSRGAPW